MKTSFDTIRALFASNTTGTITAADCIAVGVPAVSARTMLFHLCTRGEIVKVGRGEFKLGAVAVEGSVRTEPTAQVEAPVTQRRANAQRASKAGK